MVRPAAIEWCIATMINYPKNCWRLKIKHFCNIRKHQRVMASICCSHPHIKPDNLSWYFSKNRYRNFENFNTWPIKRCFKFLSFKYFAQVRRNRFWWHKPNEISEFLTCFFRQFQSFIHFSISVSVWWRNETVVTTGQPM